jgi:hypothetical protein
MGVRAAVARNQAVKLDAAAVRRQDLVGVRLDDNGTLFPESLTLSFAVNRGLAQLQPVHL